MARRRADVVLSVFRGLPGRHVTSSRLLFSRRGESSISTTETKPRPSTPHPSYRHNGIRLESCWPHVRLNPSLDRREPLSGRVSNTLTLTSNRYNKYLSVAARAVRRSLKDDKRIAAERRGEMELRFAKWSVSVPSDVLLFRAR